MAQAELWHVCGNNIKLSEVGKKDGLTDAAWHDNHRKIAQHNIIIAIVRIVFFVFFCPLIVETEVERSNTFPARYFTILQLFTHKYCFPEQTLTIRWWMTSFQRKDTGYPCNENQMTFGALRSTSPSCVLSKWWKRQKVGAATMLIMLRDDRRWRAWKKGVCVQRIPDFIQRSESAHSWCGG